MKAIVLLTAIAMTTSGQAQESQAQVVVERPVTMREWRRLPELDRAKVTIASIEALMLAAAAPRAPNEPPINVDCLATATPKDILGELEQRARRQGEEAFMDVFLDVMNCDQHTQRQPNPAAQPANTDGAPATTQSSNDGGNQ